MERRKHLRKRSLFAAEIEVRVGSDSLQAKVVDSSESGLCLELRQVLGVGTRIHVRGHIAPGCHFDGDAVVRWSTVSRPGLYRCGVELELSPTAERLEPDYYEVLQLSASADPDTIHRVFRILAQRFHPDNRETGDEEWFKVLTQAYEVLGDPAKRAAYDARRPQEQQRRWRLFDNAESAKGVTAEKRKRQGILSLLYTRKANEPTDAGAPVQELAQMLGCPKEHLEFALWFLRENGWIQRSDNGRFTITAKGCYQAEEGDQTPVAGGRLIEGRN